MSRFLFTTLILGTFTCLCAQQKTLPNLLVAELPELPLMTQRKIIAQLPAKEQKKHTYPLFVHNEKLRNMLQNYFCSKSTKTVCRSYTLLCFALSPDGKYLACCKQGSGQHYIPLTETHHDLDTNNHIEIYETTPLIKNTILSYPITLNTQALSWSQDSTKLSAHCGTTRITFAVDNAENNEQGYQMKRLYLIDGKKDNLSWVCGSYGCEVCNKLAQTDELCTVEAIDNPYPLYAPTRHLYTTLSAQFDAQIAKLAVVPRNQQKYDIREIVLIKLPHRNLLQLTLAQLALLESFSEFKISQTAIDTLPLQWRMKINHYLNQARLGALQNAGRKRLHLKQQHPIEPKHVCHDLPYITKKGEAII